MRSLVSPTLYLSTRLYIYEQSVENVCSTYTFSIIFLLNLCFQNSYIYFFLLTWLIRFQAICCSTYAFKVAHFILTVTERFRQADSSHTRSNKELGLGLAIARHLVELHGGTIQAQSQGIGQRATFTVKLPIAEESRGANTIQHNCTC